jgi:hypothetical protein
MSEPTLVTSQAGPSSRPSAQTSGKRPITLRACDACRTRKLKCSGRPDMVDVDEAGVAVLPCEVSCQIDLRRHRLTEKHCREWKLECCYLYQRKRRGRRNLVVEKLAEQQRARKDGHRGNSSSGSERSPPPAQAPRANTINPGQAFMVRSPHVTELIYSLSAQE